MTQYLKSDIVIWKLRISIFAAYFCMCEFLKKDPLIIRLKGIAKETENHCLLYVTYDIIKNTK